jgi:hypothetical protein
LEISILDEIGNFYFGITQKFSIDREIEMQVSIFAINSLFINTCSDIVFLID